MKFSCVFSGTANIMYFLSRMCEGVEAQHRVQRAEAYSVHFFFFSLRVEVKREEYRRVGGYFTTLEDSTLMGSDRCPTSQVGCGSGGTNGEVGRLADLDGSMSALGH